MPEITVIEADVGRVGPEGASAAVTFTWDTGTSDADPGAGKMRVNNAALASATALYVDDLNAAGGDVTGWLDSFDDGGASTGRGLLMLQKKGAAQNFAIYRVTGSVVDGTGYRKLTATYLGGAGSFAAGDSIAATFSPAGETGQQGDQGDPGPQGDVGPQGEPPETTTEVVAGATYEFAQSDHLKVKRFTSDSAVTATVPSGLTAPFSVGVLQDGDGQVEIAWGSPVNIEEPDDRFITAKRRAFLTIYAVDDDDFRIIGRTA